MIKQLLFLSLVFTKLYKCLFKNFFCFTSQFKEKVKKTSSLLFFILMLSTIKVYSNSLKLDDIKYDKLKLLINDGDIIFQVSQSDQAPAISEITHSIWTHVGIILKEDEQFFVAEAIQPVKLTPLKNFIERSKEAKFFIKRIENYNSIFYEKKMRTVVKKYMSKNYDSYFEFSDFRIYCSELVYKVFREVANLNIGQIQKIKDLNLEGPLAKKLIQERIINQNRTLNLDEFIITPASQFEDLKLNEVYSQIETLSPSFL